MDHRQSHAGYLQGLQSSLRRGSLHAVDPRWHLLLATESEASGVTCSASAVAAAAVNGEDKGGT